VIQLPRQPCAILRADRTVPQLYALLDDLPGQARALLRLHGPDTARFVQGTLTADVAGAPAGTAIPSVLCTPKGKIVSELVVLSEGEQCDLIVPADRADILAEDFDRHIIMDQVEVARPEPVAVAVVWTDDGGEVAAPEGDVRHFAARHPGPGRLWLGSRPAVLAALANATAVDADGWARRRIKTATPAWGAEILPDVFPAEVGFVHAVSYDKGCFLGQEPLARIHARGQVNRVLVRVASAVRVGPGTELSAPDRPQAGRLTTIAPEGDGWIGLAVVRREVAEPGRPLAAGPVTIGVTSGPLGDDPGPGRGRPATVKLGKR
jgi:folate-binding protein YgfZ